VATGFLGMNLLAEADSPLWFKVLAFLVVLAGASALTVYTIMKSKRFSDFLDALSDEHLSNRERFGALLDVWRKGPAG